jgi:hypothetical protein
MLQIKSNTSKIQRNSPMSQLIPLYPETHVHLYPLTRSLHVPPFSHGFGVHSLISVR